MWRRNEAGLFQPRKDVWRKKEEIEEKLVQFFLREDGGAVAKEIFLCRFFALRLLEDLGVLGLVVAAEYAREWL